MAAPESRHLLSPPASLLEGDLCAQRNCARIAGVEILRLIEVGVGWFKHTQTSQGGRIRGDVVQEAANVLRVIQNVEEADRDLNAGAFLKGKALRRKEIDVVYGREMAGVASSVRECSLLGSYITSVRVVSDIRHYLTGAIGQGCGAGSDIRISTRIDKGAHGSNVAA